MVKQAKKKTKATVVFMMSEWRVAKSSWKEKDDRQVKEAKEEVVLRALSTALLYTFHPWL